MRYRLSELISTAIIQGLTDSLYEAAGIPASIIELDGTILTGSGWQDLCTRFHRMNPKTLASCLESDTVIANELLTGKPYAVYTCKNGLVDMATPIRVSGKHIANLFAGQFFLETGPDEGFFRMQARECGFDERGYLEALAKIKIIGQKQFDSIVSIHGHLAKVIGEMAARELAHKEAAHALADKNAELENVFDAMPDAIVYADTERRIMKVNPAFTQLFGYAPDEVAGKHTRILYLSDDEYKQQGRLHYNTAVRNMFRPYKISYRKKDGTSFPSETVGTPVFNAADKPVGFLGIVRDISDRARIEEQLREDQKMKAIGTLAGGVAHEINNPVNGIINYAQILVDECEDSGQDNTIARNIIKEGDRIADIVKSLLTFSRYSGGEKKTVSVKSLLTDSMILTRNQLARESIAVHTAFPDDLPPIVAEPQKIEQAFINIITNAKEALADKYNGHHQNKAFEISCATIAEKSDTHVRVVFHDRGPGIPEDLLPRICEPFFSTRNKTLSTGLGLSTARAIIENNGGRLSFDTDGRSYTRVIVDFPAAE